MVFGVAMNNKSILINAANAGVSELTLLRCSGSSCTASATKTCSSANPTLSPYSCVTTAIDAAAAGLVPSASLPTVTITIGAGSSATTCASDATCLSALSTAAGQSATVQLTFPCNLQVMSHDYSGAGCPLSSSATGMVQ